jgi:hypothetical protein
VEQIRPYVRRRHSPEESERNARISPLARWHLDEVFVKGRLPPTLRPFPDPNQFFRSGRTFTFEQANKIGWDWDKAVVPWPPLE